MRLLRLPNTILLLLLAAALGLAACGSSLPAADVVDVAAADQPAAAGEALAVDEATLEKDAAGMTVGYTRDGRPFRGDPAAAILIEEFSDYQCPFCARFFEQTLPSIEDNQIAGGDAVLVFYDFPLTNIHPRAVPAAHAARCAGESGAAAYWGMHDLLFANLDSWANAGYLTAFSGYAAELGLDAAGFSACMDDQRYLDAIQTDLSAGQARGVTGTPAFFINGQFLSGAQPLAVFEQYIAAAAAGQVVADLPVPTPTQVIPPTPATLNSSFAGALGDPDAAVVIVEFTDYGCPYCAQYSQQTLPAVITDLVETGQAYYMLKDLPLDSLHPEARAAANAARCAGDQNAYWEMHDLLFERQAAWLGQGDAAAEASFLSLGDELGLNMDEFTPCVIDAAFADAVEANAQEALALGAQSTPSFFINGFPLRGAQPLEIFTLAVGAAAQGDDVIAELYVPRPTPTPAPAPPIEVGDAPTLGDPNAPITIVEFSDFQCPFCYRHTTETLPLLLENYIATGQVYYVYKQFAPNLVNPSFHPQSASASLAALCAQEQDAFWEMHELLFLGQQEWGIAEPTDLFVGYATTLGLDSASFRSCLESEKYLERVQNELLEGRAQGITGTPSFVINGNLVVGAQPYAAFEQVFSQLETAP